MYIYRFQGGWGPSSGCGHTCCSLPPVTPERMDAIAPPRDQATDVRDYFAPGDSELRPVFVARVLGRKAA